MPAPSGRLSAIMSTGHEAELHSRARASWTCSRARSPRPRRILSAPKAEGRMQGVSPTGPSSKPDVLTPCRLSGSRAEVDGAQRAAKTTLMTHSGHRAALHQIAATAVHKVLV